MKKRLEAELISIAHRILKLKNKSEVDQLYKESRKLYETLSVLKFYQDNFEVLKSDISLEEIESKLEETQEEEPLEKEVVASPAPIKEEIEETVTEVSDESFEDNDVVEEEDLEDHEEEIISEDKAIEFEPMFQLDEEEESEEEITNAKNVKVETFLGEDYVEPVFVKPNEVSLFSEHEKEETKEYSETLNDTLSKSITFGLNDKIGFVKHLFGGSNEDFNRVVSQLNTFETFEEAKDFINEIVIPDYNYWVGEEDYIERFMEVVEKKFK